MSEREFVWTPESKAQVLLLGLSLSQVIEALYSPLRVEWTAGDLLLFVIGPDNTGLVLTIISERIAGTLIYKIQRVFPTGEADIAAWKEATR